MVIPQFGMINTLLRHCWSNGEGVYFISFLRAASLPFVSLKSSRNLGGYLAMSSHHGIEFDLLKSIYSSVEIFFRRWFEKSKRNREELEYKSFQNHLS